MGLPVPKDVTDRLDTMEESMESLVSGITRVVELLEEQNNLLRDANINSQYD